MPPKKPPLLVRVNLAKSDSPEKKFATKISDWNQLIQRAKKFLKMTGDIYFFTRSGSRIVEFRVIDYDEVIYVSEKEHFEPIELEPDPLSEITKKISDISLRMEKFCSMVQYINTFRGMCFLGEVSGMMPKEEAEFKPRPCPEE